MIYRPVLPGGLVQVPPLRPLLPGGYFQSPLRPVLPGGIISVVSESDPLDGYAWAARLQSPVGMYQDVGFTTPAVDEFDPVAAWRDELTESGVAVTQDNPDRFPIVLDSALGCDGVDDYLAGDVEASATSYTMAAVIENPSGGTGNFRVAVTYGPGASSNTTFIGVDGSGNFICSNSNASNDLPSTTSGGRVVIVAEVNAGQIRWWLDGVLVGSSSTNVNARGSDLFTVGAYGSAFCYDGTVFFAGVIEGVLTDGERNALISALSALYI